MVVCNQIRNLLAEFALRKIFRGRHTIKRRGERLMDDREIYGAEPALYRNISPMGENPRPFLRKSQATFRHLRAFYP
jgi:hypothetical protein